MTSGGAANARITVDDHQDAHSLDCGRLLRMARSAYGICLDNKASSAVPLKALGEIEISLIDDEEIARIHGEFMGIPDPTDVITFEHGEILVSTETAERQRVEHGSPSLEREVALYIVHGLLHLAGYDDRTPREFEKMAELQEAILARVWEN